MRYGYFHKLKHRLTSLTALLLVALAALHAAGAPRPTGLVIVIDDLNDWITPLGGHPQTMTPNFERLAKSSVLFKTPTAPRRRAIHRAQSFSPACRIR